MVQFFPGQHSGAAAPYGVWDVRDVSFAYQQSGNHQYSEDLDTAFGLICIPTDGSIIEQVVGGLGIDFMPEREALKTMISYPVSFVDRPFITHSKHGGKFQGGRGPNSNKFGMAAAVATGGAKWFACHTQILR